MSGTDAYAKQLANRLLAGSGIMSFVAYRNDATSQIVVLEHGLDSEGRPCVKCWQDDVAHLPNTAVRFDVNKQALEWGSAITFASLHGLATIEWQPGGGSVRVGTLHVEDLHLHWPAGTVRIPLSEVDPNVHPFDELDALQALNVAGIEHLRSLHTEVEIGISKGTVLSDMPYPLHEHQKNRLWVGDASTTGLVLIASTENRLVTTLVDLPLPAHDPTDLVRAVSAAIL